MNNVRLQLAFMGETVSPPGARFSSTWLGTFRFPTPLHVHRPVSGP